MTIKNVFLTMLAMLFMTIANASFPVTENHQVNTEEVVISKPIEKESKKSKKSWFKRWATQQNGFSIAALCCGIVGLFVAAIPLGICAIIFGAIGRSKGKPGMATAGMILGIIDIALVLIFVL